MANEQVQASFEQRLQTVRQGFVDGLKDRGLRLGQLWREVESGDLETLPEFHRIVHTLAGSSATFGFDEITRAARELEVSLKPLLDEAASLQDVDDGELKARLARLHEAICQVADCRRRPADSPLPAGNDIPKETHAEPEDVLRIHLLERDEALAAELGRQLAPFGYRLEAFSQPRDLCAAASVSRPAAVILDRDQDGQGGTDERLLRKLVERCSIEAPVIVISSQQDFQARLEAVRAGGKAFLEKPVEISELVEMLDRLARPLVDDACRVLVIDDSVAQAEYHATILQQAGMLTRTVNLPAEAIEAIEGFAPDLILMDMYMPECNGLELAAVIRQQPAYLGIPVVFLSSETDVDLQLEAMSHGGDDFLVKPVLPDHLVSAIETRVGRSRLLRNQMIRDSLTGLYNHVTIKEYLDREFHRAERNGMPLSLVMLDIDHFKQVNDRYGHVSGDHVIKGLARMLVQRLRRADLVGRYGGEEFAIILPETEASTAVRLMDALREAFGRLFFHSTTGRFSTSFSAGVAGFPAAETPGHLIELADQALYKAKETGRNRVRQAG